MTMQTPQPQLPPTTPSLAEVKRFLAEHPGDPDGLNSLGALLNQGGKREAAILHYHRALAVAPDHAMAWSNLALLLTAMGRHARAIACARVAVALAPDNPTACLNLTAALYKSGDFATDLMVLERLVRLQPDNPSLTWGRAQVRLHQGDYVQGFADYEGRYWLQEYHYRIHRGPRWTGGPLDGPCSAKAMSSTSVRTRSCFILRA